MVNIAVNEIGDLSPEGQIKAMEFISEQTARVAELLKDYPNATFHSVITAESAVIFAEIYLDTPEDIKALGAATKN
jgi:hypothetical protein